MDDEIWLTSDMEFVAVGKVLLPSLFYPNDKVIADVPSIAAKHKGDLAQIPVDRALYRHREQVAEFDFSLGDGWVNTEVAGWLYIRPYPWVWHPVLGWLLAMEAGIYHDTFLGEFELDPKYQVSSHFNENQPSSLTFYFHSATYGWLWKSRVQDEFFVFNRAEFLTAESLLSASMKLP